jgi:putative ABC transport system ATP-binding protein
MNSDDDLPPLDHEPGAVYVYQHALPGSATGNLDEDTRDEIIALLEKLWRERSLTMVLVTHETSVARRAERIAVMSKGRLTIST